jgi:hypothetical protein
VKKAPKALEEIDEAWGKRAADGWKEIFTEAEWDEAWGLLKQVQPDVKKIAVWTQHGHKVEDGDHLASVSLKQEGGIGRLVITIGDAGVPVAGHPGFGKEEEEEEEGDRTTTGAIAVPEAGVKAVGATAKTPPEKKETEGEKSGETVESPPKKKEAGLPQKKRTRAAEAPQSQEREEGPSTEPTNPPLKCQNSPTGGAKEGAQLPTEHAPRGFTPRGLDKYLRRQARKAAKKAKLEKGIHAEKAPGEPGAQTSEQHKVEGGGEGMERGLEQVGVERSGVLIYIQQLEEKAEILRTEAPVRVENEEGKGRKESEMGDGEGSQGG